MVEFGCEIGPGEEQVWKVARCSLQGRIARGFHGDDEIDAAANFTEPRFVIIDDGYCFVDLFEALRYPRAWRHAAHPVDGTPVCWPHGPSALVNGSLHFVHEFAVNLGPSRGAAAVSVFRGAYWSI